jgi:alpha 1,2-mannosyltransferase
MIKLGLIGSPTRSHGLKNFVPLTAIYILILLYLVTYFITGINFLRTTSVRVKEPSHDIHNHARPIGADGNITQSHAESWILLLEQIKRFPPAKEEPHKTSELTEPYPLFREAKNDSLQQCYSMSDENLLQTQQAHAAFVASIATDPSPLYYRPGTRGLVATVGPDQLPSLVINLRMLRRTGSTSPVEVFISSPKDYEPFICEIVLPALNAHCLMLSDILEIDGFSGFQFKFLSILFSTFEEILFLDADVCAIQNPDPLFDSEPFKSYGFVVWPDFWASTASPYIYNITSQLVPPRALHPTVEAGELLLSRKTHQMSLFLVAYYNYYGPSHYFGLFTQGGAGEGDKETWRTAAAVMKQPFYQVHNPIQGIGRSIMGSDNRNAMVQYDPIVDYLRTGSNEHGHKHPDARPMFIHANYPEFNPQWLVGKDDDFRIGFAWHDGQRSRIWPLEGVIGTLGDDIEKQLWEEVMWTACELEGKFVNWESWDDTKSMCQRVHDAWNDIFEFEY